MKNLLIQLGTLLTIISVMFFFTPIAFASGGIAFDNASDSGNVTGFPATVTYSLTVGSGANRVLVVFVSCFANNLGVPGVTYNGTSMTLARNGAVNGTSGLHMFAYYLVNPSSGAHNVVIDNSVTAYSQVASEALSYTGVNQSTPVDVANDGEGTGGGLSGNMTLSATTMVDKDWGVMGASGESTLSAGTNNTNRVTGGGANNLLLSGDTNADQTPAGSYSMAVTGGAFAQATGIILFIEPVQSIVVNAPAVFALKGGSTIIRGGHTVIR